MRIWRQRGEHQQAIGRSRGGRTTKIHALTDAECRPVAFLLTAGQIADCTAGAVLLEEMPRAAILHGDKGYDSDVIRRQVEGKGAMPNIPPKGEPTLEELLLARPLSKPQRDRAHVLSPEGLPSHRHQIRSSRNQFPRSRLHRCGCQLLVMSLDPRLVVEIDLKDSGLG
ncbi:transposase [Nitrobacter vulgaris]|uniref:transposase n=1 Tax=Nitrobacter vulgaris TaxID=29421 RepID=UPI00404344DD